MNLMGTIIQSLWVGNKLSTMERLCCASYMAQGHEFHLYTYSPVENIPKGVLVRDANEIMPEMSYRFQYLAQFADWWRYNLIYQKGGWWVDMDTVCLKPFDDLDHETVLEGYIKAPIGSPVMAWLIEQCKLENWMEMQYAQIGPILYRKAHEHFDFQDYTWPDVLHCFKDEESPKVYIDPQPRKIPETAHAAHLFNGMWRESKCDVDAEYPRTCLYEQFKRLYL